MNQVALDDAEKQRAGMVRAPSLTSVRPFSPYRLWGGVMLSVRLLYAISRAVKLPCPMYTLKLAVLTEAAGWDEAPVGSLKPRALMLLPWKPSN